MFSPGAFLLIFLCPLLSLWTQMCVSKLLSGLPGLLSLYRLLCLSILWKKRNALRSSHMFLFWCFPQPHWFYYFFPRLLKAKFRTKPCMHLKLTTEHASIHYLFCSTFPITELSQPERALFESEVAVYGCPASVSRWGCGPPFFPWGLLCPLTDSNLASKNIHMPASSLLPEGTY